MQLRPRDQGTAARRFRRLRPSRLVVPLALAVCVPIAALDTSGSQAPAATGAPAAPFKVLVFSKTAAFRHSSIGHATKVLKQLGSANGFAVDATESGSRFTTAKLAPYAAVVFLMTTGDVLNGSQQKALKAFVT